MNSKYLTSRLLSGKNQLSRLEKDEIFENVLADVAPVRRSIWWRPGAFAALAGAVAVLLIVPIAMRGNTSDSGGEFTARGNTSAVAAFDLACSDKSGRVCQSEDTLLFDLNGSAGYQYFAAFARRDDGTVIWYFPESPAGRSLDLTENLANGVLDRGVALEGAANSGHYRVYGVFSNEPLSRDDIKLRFQEGATDLGPETSITTREFTVE